MKTTKLYDSIRHSKLAPNFTLIGKLTIVIHSIDRAEVYFVLNPNIENFAQSTTTQELSFSVTDDTVFLRLSRANPALPRTAAGRCGCNPRSPQRADTASALSESHTD